MFYEPAGGHGLPRDPFKSLVVPRPIGWISTLDPDGVANLAPYSFFNAVSDSPPTVLFAANGVHAEGGLKDSARNAERAGEFVCNLVTWDLRERMNATAAMLPRSADEFAVAGLTPAVSRVVAAPRVAESPVCLECRYLHTVSLPAADPARPNTVVFGEVVGVHIDDAFIEDGRVRVDRLRPVARLGYMEYAVVESVFELNRPG